jgi:hypothetical protein
MNLTSVIHLISPLNATESLSEESSLSDKVRFCIVQRTFMLFYIFFQQWGCLTWIYVSRFQFNLKRLSSSQYFKAFR